jgi:hypothetical protein
VPGSSVAIVADPNSLEQVPLVTVTSTVGADSVSFGIDCDQDNTHGANTGIHYDFISLAAVVLSDA